MTTRFSSAMTREISRSIVVLPTPGGPHRNNGEPPLGVSQTILTAVNAKWLQGPSIKFESEAVGAFCCRVFVFAAEFALVLAELDTAAVEGSDVVVRFSWERLVAAPGMFGNVSCENAASGFAELFVGFFLRMFSDCFRFVLRLFGV